MTELPTVQHCALTKCGWNVNNVCLQTNYHYRYCDGTNFFNKEGKECQEQ